MEQRINASDPSFDEYDALSIITIEDERSAPSSTGRRLCARHQVES
jgi:hypothetical protein